MKRFIFPLIATLSGHCLADTSHSKLDSTSYDCNEITVSQQVDDCVKNKLNESNNLLTEELNLFKLRTIQNYKPDPKIGIQYINTVQKAHAAWLTFRNFECKVNAYEIDVGTPAYITTVNSCIILLNENRIKDIKKL